MVFSQFVRTCCLAAGWLLLSAMAATAQPPADDLPATELDTADFAVVEDRTRGFNKEELGLLRKLLAGSRQTSAEARREAAHQLILDRRRNMKGLANRSDSEFLVEDLLRSPDVYRGRFVTIAGYARGAEKIEANAGPRGVESYYRVRIFVEEGDFSPVDVYCLSLPENWPAGQPVIDDVSVVGRFFKLMEYDDPQSGHPAIAPVILAERVDYASKIQPGNVRLNPALWEGVVHHNRRGWTNAERDLYYRVLKHAADGDAAEQRKQAKKNRRAAIERYLTNAEREHKALLAKAEEFRQQHPDQQETYQTLLDQADRRHRGRLIMYRRYREQPELFPLYADLVANDHVPYNGQLITLRGRLRQITKSPADENVRYDLETLYELWLYSEDSQAHPTVVVCTSVPDGIMELARETGTELNAPITVTGYFFKMYVYDAHDSVRFAPLLLAGTFEWHPPAPPPESQLSPFYIVPFFALLLLGMVYIVWRTRAEDKRFRRRMKQVEGPASVSDFGHIDLDATASEPTFDNIEAADEPPLERGTRNDER